MLPLADNAVHLWHLDRSAIPARDLQASCLGWLDPGEKVRYERFHLDRHRQMFLLGRFLIRATLSRYAPLAPERWQFQVNEYGKPAIVPGQHSGALHFNLSHSGSRLTLAVGRQLSLGVDIEAALKPRRIAAIANRYFASEEAAAMLALPEVAQLDRFYELWTLKEAYIKARGKGLTIALGSFSFTFPAQSTQRMEFCPPADDPGPWQFWQLDSQQGGKIALAVVSGSVPITAIESFRYSGIDSYQNMSARIQQAFSSARTLP